MLKICHNISLERTLVPHVGRMDQDIFIKLLMYLQTTLYNIQYYTYRLNYMQFTRTHPRISKPCTYSLTTILFFYSTYIFFFLYMKKIQTLLPQTSFSVVTFC
uniref:Uncharacterized protein n=1 Tax=Cacopsylla melanoneura TaxID=428564 RepID=A0A8D8QUD2_9HEMI